MWSSVNMTERRLIYADLLSISNYQLEFKEDMKISRFQTRIEWLVTFIPTD